MPLRKPNGKPRPLAIPDALRRLTCSAVCEQYRAQFREVLEPDGCVAVGTPAATEAIPKLVRARANRAPSWPVGKIDAINGYGCMGRRGAGAALSDQLAELARFWATWYARASTYILRRPDGFHS